MILAHREQPTEKEAKASPALGQTRYTEAFSRWLWNGDQTKLQALGLGRTCPRMHGLDSTQGAKGMAWLAEYRAEVVTPLSVWVSSRPLRGKISP